MHHSLFGGDRSDIVNHKKYLVRASDLNDKYLCNFVALDQDIICEDIPSVQSGPWCHELHDLHIQLTDVDSIDRSITVLIGADVAGKLFTGRQHKLRCGLTAMETSLGWTVMGAIAGRKPRQDPAVTALCLFAGAHDVPSLWSLDALGIKDPIERKTREIEEAEMEKRFLETVKVRKDGRYEVALPWNEGHPPLPENKEMARRRLESTARRLLADGLYDEYAAVLEEWRAQGIIERVPDVAENDWGHYLPHRHVVKANSTTKIRPVFDASARLPPHPSLNDCVQKGPNLIELIPTIFLRFRKGCIGVISDIRKAFLQIGIRQEDRDFLRFLWFDDDGKIIVMRHCRVVFGVSCSPFILGAVIVLHLNNVMRSVEKNVDSICFIENIIRLAKSYYVDNCVTSVNTEEQLISFMNDATNVMNSANFDLRGWEYSGDRQPSERTVVLGMFWNKRNDSLSIDTTKLGEIESYKITKRNILSIAHRVFDPLGVVAPVMLMPRLILRETWRKKLTWDEEVDNEIKTKFIKWAKELKQLECIEIPRCFLGRVEDEDKITMHTFCDASGTAYAVVIFIRIERRSNVEIKFVQAKTRVAPSKSDKGSNSRVTIPRLELLAATIGARLTAEVMKAGDLGICENFYWSDSTTVLAWIQRNCHWSVFVQNRVTEIRELSKLEQWRHIPGQFNPADLPSRGCTASQLVQSRWWEGPEWLRETPDRWPLRQVSHDEEQINMEIRKTTRITESTLTMLMSEKLGKEDPWYARFSHYGKILRWISWIQRFCYNCRCVKEKRRCGELCVEEIKLAEIFLIKSMQFENLKNRNDENIKHMRLKEDENGLIRVESKIILRDDTYEFRYPVVLPRDHKLTDLIIKGEHEFLQHAGVEITLSSLREKYWILGGRKKVRSVIRNCLNCRRHDAQPLETLPAPLPLNRIRDAAIFEIIGVDLAGPISLKDSKKAWICIFTCAVYRAVHFELVTSLSTDAFLMALRRHIARRGRPVNIYSDNGTNFVGLSNKLKDLDFARLRKFTTSREIQWTFNPPSAPWWGGFWERMIGILKRLLRRTLKKTCLTYEEMLTLLADCEAVINSRPITFMADGDEEVVPLTPAMFLQDIKEVGVPDLDSVEKQSFGKRYAYRQRIKECLRKRFRIEYLGALMHKTKNRKITGGIKIGDIVLVGYDNLKRMDWPLARVKEIIKGKDGTVRIARLITSAGELTRAIQRIYPLEIKPEHDHFDGQNVMQVEEIVEEKNSNVGEVFSDVSETNVKVQMSRYGRAIKQPVRLSYM